MKGMKRMKREKERREERGEAEKRKERKGENRKRRKERREKGKGRRKEIPLLTSLCWRTRASMRPAGPPPMIATRMGAMIVILKQLIVLFLKKSLFSNIN